MVGDLDCIWREVGTSSLVSDSMAGGRMGMEYEPEVYHRGAVEVEAIAGMEIVGRETGRIEVYLG